MHPMTIVSRLRIVLAAGALALAGCATSYVVPGPRADMRAFGGGTAGASAPGGASPQDSLALKPAVTFPATLAFVRVQAPGYSSYSVHRAADSATISSAYSVIATREVEDDTQVDRLGRLPQIAGTTTISRMLLPTELRSDRELRDAAARLHADLLLVYTFDTNFFETDQARPLTVITLGLSPTRKFRVSTTVSALLLDTRTGYIYAAYDTTHKAEARSTSWSTGDTADETRRDNERQAFGQLMDEVEKTWPKLLAQYGHQG